MRLHDTPPGSDHAGAAEPPARARHTRRRPGVAGPGPRTPHRTRARPRAADGSAADVGAAAVHQSGVLWPALHESDVSEADGHGYDVHGHDFHAPDVDKTDALEPDVREPECRKPDVRETAISASTTSSDAIGLAVPDSLVYVTDEVPGYRRERRGADFVYLRPDGKKLADAADLDRIRRLAIPPAYREVWICPQPNGHLQATGRDAKGRKQYRYHPEWRTARDTTKFERMEAFGSALPRIRARVKRDLDAPLGGHLSRTAVIAAVVRLLDTTLIRIGNDEYARTNKSYGLTTLKPRHAALHGSELRLKFRGKSGVQHEAAVEDKRIAKVIRRCQALRGQALFHYEDSEGAVHDIDSGDVNDYLREASSGEFTAKDFRTWHGSVLALSLWHGRDEPAPMSRRDASALLSIVADRLGNTPAVCRKAYVHPRVLEAWLDAPPDPLPAVPRKVGLSIAERHFLRFLRSGAAGLGEAPDCLQADSA